ncbi:MAG: 30S ribosomal protein S1 [Gemmatimonadales bacterium]|nr:30S ribosomal protein S1 [Gemmatimonadales bacterium]
MTTNPNSDSEEVRDDSNQPPLNQKSQPALGNLNKDQADDSDQEDTGSRSAAAEVLPTPPEPRLSVEYDPESIVNIDYMDDDGDAEDLGYDEMLALINQYEETLTDIQEGQILQGTVIEVRDNEVLLNIGFKSEGVIDSAEFGGTMVAPGDSFDVFLEKLENQDGLVVLSKERADFLKVWDKIKVAHEAGDVVSGLVDRRIKGGLVVKLWGVDTFLPGSQVALRQVPNLEDMIGEEIHCRIIKKNKRRRNVVVSRRIVLELEREEKKRALISELEKGQVRTGVVKNITDFGAFVDLGGIDGLLHITDLSWGRVSHPSEVVSIGQEIEVKVLDFEEVRERISLGLKQLQSYPWDDVEGKYPEESIVRGRVVSITNYGAFVELEKGVEGLIHISEMSWTRHIKHPSKVVSIGDEVDVMVLKIDKDNEKISLGLKQCESDPWLTLIERYPVGSVIEGKVRNLTDFGAFVEVEEGIDGLVHISDMSWTKRVRHPKEVLKRGDSVQVQILDIETNKRRISLGIKQMHENPWPGLAEAYPVGHLLEGAISRMLDHGVIVGMGEELEGFVPLGHLGIPKLDKPQYYFKEEEEVELKVIKMDVENRRIVLSIAERLKDYDENVAEEFITNHPRLEDVVAAEEAAAAEAEAQEGAESASKEKDSAEDDYSKVAEEVAAPEVESEE